MINLLEEAIGPGASAHYRPRVDVAFGVLSTLAYDCRRMAYFICPSAASAKSK
jgi:hypothetical protein